MNRRGFSLIEALIATVLVASAAALLYGVLAQISRGQQLRERQAVARRVLANHLALLDVVPAGLVQQGEEPSPQGPLTWSLTTAPGPDPSLTEATLTVSWPMGAGAAASRASVRATTYRRAPEPPL